MENKIIKSWKLGMFVALSLTVFLVAIYFIGKSQNLFGTTFHLQAKFKNVSGLQIGNNVQLSGINIGTVKEIEFLSDSIVMVNMVIRSEIQQYIKTDAFATIGSDGLMGDKVLMITAGSTSQEIVKDHALILSTEAVGIEDLMNGLKKSIDNAQVITKELSEFSHKMNNGKGALAKVLTDEEFSRTIDKTLHNLERGTDEFVLFTKNMNNKNGSLSKIMTDPVYANSIEKTLSGFEKSAADINVFTSKLRNENGIISKLLSDEKMANDLDSILINTKAATEKLNELEEAAKHNFLLRGYFRRQEKAKDKIEAEKNQY
ncbi:MAG: MlaD family protein [Flavobacteriaceae bacterium]|nr:MlaD family protein [Flavobacteriaceae bacterium]